MKHDANERYQSADEMLADIEHVLRNVYRPVGQTELKRWLAELSAHDGTPSILKGGARQTASRTGTGTGELDGKDVVLSDSQELLEDDIDGEAVTSLAVVEAGGGGRMRMSRQRPTAPTPLALPVPRDAEAELEGRASEELSALPIPDTEEPPDRRRLRSGGGWTKVLFVCAFLILGAWVFGKYGREWFHLGEGPTSAGGPAAGQPAEKLQKAPAPAPEPAAVNPKPAPRAAEKPAAEKAAGAGQGGEAASAGPAREEPKTEKPAAREPAGRRNRPTAERANASAKPGKERDRLHSIDLKSMMAPDPSQLPAPEPAKPAPPPAPSEPPAQENQ
jgi:hypothetical protein